MQQKTALILGGGGPAGIAWECGLLLGLQDGGIDLSNADRIVGTSAGSIVGTHLAVVGSVEELYTARENPLDEASKPPSMARLFTALILSKLFHRSVEGQRRSIGKAARRARVQGEPEWLARISALLPKTSGDGWPERDLCITSVDIDSGQLKVWTRQGGVPLAVAVASSCAVPCVFPLVHHGTHTYMDGGMGSPTNAALGAGFGTVLLLDPIARLMGRHSQLPRERQQLEAQGSTVLPFVFDDRVHALVGRNLMDSAHAHQIAELGREQGQRAAKQLVNSHEEVTRRHRPSARRTHPDLPL